MTTTNQPTDAWKKADEYRDMLVGDRKRLIKVVAKDYSSVAYLYHTENDRPVAMIFKGRARKAVHHYSYQDQIARAKRVMEIMAGYANRPSRKRPERELDVDDVLRASWGYDQTNVDYYKVTKLIGKTMVEVVEIGAEKEYTHMDQGKIVPDENHIIGKPMRRVAQGQSVRIDSVRYASKLGYKTVAGVRLYEASHWSSYH